MSFSGEFHKQPIDSFSEPKAKSASDEVMAEVNPKGMNPGGMILQAALEGKVGERDEEGHSFLQKFLAERSWPEKLAVWLGKGDLRKWSASKKRVMPQFKLRFGMLVGRSSRRIKRERLNLTKACSSKKSTRKR